LARGWTCRTSASISLVGTLHALRHLAGEVGRGHKVDAKVFRQILYYLDVFPERFHRLHRAAAHRAGGGGVA
jgi:hypothetical protein